MGGRRKGTPKGLGARLRRARLERGLTQKELAAPSYSHAYVSIIESGRKEPSPDALEYFARKLGADAEELATGVPADLEPRLRMQLNEARIALSAGRLDEAETAFRSVARSAKRFGLAPLQAKAEEGRGLSAERCGDAERALEHYCRAEELLRDEADLLKADAVAGKAGCFEMLGDFRYATYILEAFLERLKSQRLDDPDALLRIHSSLVYAYFNAGLFRQAESSAREALRLSSRVSEPLRIAQMHMNVARVLLQQSHVGQAERSLARAEDIYRQLELKTEMGGAHLARGYVACREENFDEAAEQLELARSIFRETENALDESRAVTELGRLKRLQGDRDEAVRLLESAIDLLGDGDVAERGLAHRELGHCYGQDDPALAEKHLRTATDLFEHAEAAGELALTYAALGELLEEQGARDAAMDAYRSGILATRTDLGTM